MAADRAHTAHRNACPTCQAQAACAAEAQLEEHFARLQRAYLNRLKNRP